MLPNVLKEVDIACGRFNKMVWPMRKPMKGNVFGASQEYFPYHFSRLHRQIWIVMVAATAFLFPYCALQERGKRWPKGHCQLEMS
jgi:hypothetical protein